MPGGLQLRTRTYTGSRHGYGLDRAIVRVYHHNSTGSGHSANRGRRSVGLANRRTVHQTAFRERLATSPTYWPTAVLLVRPGHPRWATSSTPARPTLETLRESDYFVGFALPVISLIRTLRYQTNLPSSWKPMYPASGRSFRRDLLRSRSITCSPLSTTLSCWPMQVMV